MNRTAPSFVASTALTAAELNKLPRGWVLYELTQNAQATPTGGDVAVFSTSFAAQAGRSYLVKAFLADTYLTGGAQNSGIVARLYIDGVIRDSSSYTLVDGNVRAPGFTLNRRWATTSAGTVSVGVQLQMLGAARATCEAGSELWVLDVGPSS